MNVSSSPERTGIKMAVSRRGRWAWLALVVALPMAGCGTRVSDARIDAADGSARSAVTRDSAGVGATPAGADSLLGGQPAAAPAAAQAPSVPTAGGTVAAGAPAAGTTVAATGKTPKTAKVQGAAAAGEPVAAVATGPNSPCKATLAPVPLGQTAPTSGIIGASTANLRTGLALWVRFVNTHGGVQCHPVEMYQMDDGADPARVTSNLTELVRSHHVVAIIAAGIPTTFPAGQTFADKNKIPFVGGDLIEPAWFNDPWMFPQGGSALAAYTGGIREAARSVKATTAGLIYCVEASICGTINKNFEAMAAQSGLKTVLRKVSSITNPDYTAECQAMKSAKAEVVFYSLEGAGSGRLSRSCRALNYSPPVATAALAVSATAAEDPNLRAQGVYLGTGDAPFTASDTPGTKEFQAAYNTYAPGSQVDEDSINAWTSGKLFEAAIANVYEQARNGPITTQMVLDGLWKVDGDTLNGLAPPLKFNKGVPATQNDCYFSLTITEKGYGSPKGSKYECFKGLPTGF
jgi:branched-chain amino acid transport system substrate-binding protein